MILFSDTGGGHRAAAAALTGAMRELDPGVRVELCDPLLGDGRPVVRTLASLYPPIIQRARPLWGAIYHASNTKPSFAALRGALGAQVGQVIGGCIEAADPDLVLSVHPLVNHLAYRAIKRSGRRRGLMTVITDLVELHRGWGLPQVDALVVPTEAAAQEVIRMGVPSHKVHLYGLPVALRFRPPAPGEREALRRAWGLNQSRPTLLVMGGGEGSGKLLQQVRALAWREHPWQVIAVCGRNEKLRRRLSRLRFATPTVILGFVDTVPELLRTADLVVTKAGPGAIAEALATEIPMILTGYLPGQETPNVRFVTESRIGVYAPRPDQLQQAVQDVLVKEEGAQLRAMAARAAELSRPYAALDIARDSLSLALRYSAASQARR